MKIVKCKRCDMDGLSWYQTIHGKWMMRDKNGEQHRCDDGNIKAVKCKYCNAADLYWAEELNTVTQQKKAILTESYGLPHACDERIAFIAKEKQDKKDKYEAEKKRINATPTGPCEPCKGSGNGGIVLGAYSHCPHCYGHGQFSDKNKKSMLATIRRQIWPNMADTYPHGRRW